jgi:hypothetical protein
MAMPHRNNIAGSSLRRNRKGCLETVKKRRIAGLSGRSRGGLICTFFVRRNNKFCAIGPIGLQIHQHSRIHETITALQQELRLSRAGRCGSVPQ